MTGDRVTLNGVEVLVDSVQREYDHGGSARMFGMDSSSVRYRERDMIRDRIERTADHEARPPSPPPGAAAPKPKTQQQKDQELLMQGLFSQPATASKPSSAPAEAVKAAELSRQLNASGERLAALLGVPQAPKVREWTHGPTCIVQNVVMPERHDHEPTIYCADENGTPFTVTSMVTPDDCICQACESIIGPNARHWGRYGGGRKWCASCMGRRVMLFVQRSLDSRDFVNGFAGDLAVQLEERNAELAQARSDLANLHAVLGAIRSE